MGFFDSIAESLNVGKNTFFRAMLFDGALHVEGVKQICKYTAEEIVIRLKKDALTISGSELFVKKYCAGDLVVCGKIKSITLI